MKLIRKQRTGAKVKKTYDQPRTPYQRLLDSSALSKPAKQQLRTQYAGLNPAELKRNIVRLQTRHYGKILSCWTSGKHPVSRAAIWNSRNSVRVSR